MRCVGGESKRERERERAKGEMEDRVSVNGGSERGWEVNHVPGFSGFRFEKRGRPEVEFKEKEGIRGESKREEEERKGQRDP